METVTLGPRASRPHSVAVDLTKLEPHDFADLVFHVGEGGTPADPPGRSFSSSEEHSCKHGKVFGESYS